MSIHGTDPLEGLEEGSKKYLEMTKRLAQKDLESREGEIRVIETSIGSAKKSLRHSVVTTIFSVAIAADAGYLSYKLLITEDIVEARAKTTCTDLAKKFQTPATPKSLSLCEQHARESIQREDHNNLLPGLEAALFSTAGGLLTIVGLKACALDAATLSRRRRELKGYQSNASETREEIKGLDERLASLDLG